MKNNFDTSSPGSPEEDRLVGDFVRQLNNKTLRNKYAQQIMLHEGIVCPDTDSDAGTAPQSVRIASLWTRRTLAYAATVLLLIALGIGFQLNNSSSETEQLLASMLDVEDYIVPISRSAAPAQLQPDQRTERDIFLYYGAKKFDKVVALKNNNTGPGGRLYIALALIESGQPEEALRQLAMIPADDPEYGEESRWFSALLRIKTGDTITGKKLLQAFVTSRSVYSGGAQQLLRSLEEK